MAINFNNIGPNQVKTDGSPKALDQALKENSSASSSAPSPATGNERESVRFSDTAQQLSSLSQSIRDSAAIDQDRVESIRKAISEGQYHIDPARLASNIVNLELDLST